LLENKTELPFSANQFHWANTLLAQNNAEAGTPISGSALIANHSV
jgi:hypothetical protein